MNDPNDMLPEAPYVMDDYDRASALGDALEEIAADANKAWRSRASLGASGDMEVLDTIQKIEAKCCAAIARYAPAKGGN